MYDAQKESVLLIENGASRTGPFDITRRRRFVPLAVDVEGDVAATLFVRRGVSGLVHLEAWALERLNEEWRLLGGGGGAPCPDLASERASMGTLGAAARRVQGGATARRSADTLWPRRTKHVRFAVLEVAAEVDRLEGRERVVPVLPHGHAIVVWSSRATPSLEAVGGDDQALGAIDLTSR